MKQITLYLLLMLFSVTFCQNFIGIPDTNFEQALIDAGYDDNLDNYINVENVENVIFLDVSSSGITSLEGIEGFVNLEYLSCSNNLITQLNICSNLSLKFLECSNNNIEAINLSRNVLLETFVADNNNLNNIDLSQNSMLTNLSIANNPVSCIQVGDLFSSPNNFLDASLNIDLNNQDYFAIDCGFIEIPCSGFNFLGTVFFDDNQNGIKDNNELEIGLGNEIIYRDINNQNFSPTNSSNNPVEKGEFKFLLDDGVYLVDVIPQTNWVTTTNPISVTVDDLIPDVDNIEIGIWSDYPQGHSDFSVDLTATNQICGFGGTIFINYENRGVVSSGVEIILQLDQGNTQTYSNSNVEPTSVSSDNTLITWNIPDVGVNQQGVITVNYDVPPGGAVQASTVTSTEVYLTATDLYGIMSETNLQNNYDIFQDVILCAYDPNDKLVFPATGDENYVEFSDTLEYTVRFQNVGNYYAFNIRVEDTISNFLDLSTFRLIGSSHNVHYEFGDERAIAFYFDNIMLPDSISDPLGSQGFVKFAIAPNDNLDEFTIVENTGHIYFDYNEAIVTNTTFSTFVSEITYGCIDSEACNYSPNSLIEDSSICEYSQEFYDCSGFCINDYDTDLICDEIDNCPGHYNPNQEDEDLDGIGDVCDGNISIESHILESKKIRSFDVLGRPFHNVKSNNKIIFIIGENGNIEKYLLNN